MTRLAEIEAHIASMSELSDIVGAMRALASMRVQEAHRALPSVTAYAETVAEAIGAALLLAPGSTIGTSASVGSRALILNTAEHGFIGGFNERLLDAAQAFLKRGDKLFVLGSRGAVLADERGCEAAWAYPMATRPHGVPETIRRLTAELYRGIARGDIVEVETMFTRHRQQGGTTIERRRLMPFDLARFALAQPRLAPLHNLAPERLLEKLVADYIFALLTEAAIESLASENAARFAAMEAAHDNVSKKLDQLRQEGRQARQGEITEELLDLMTGADAF